MTLALNIFLHLSVQFFCVFTYNNNNHLLKLYAICLQVILGGYDMSEMHMSHSIRAISNKAKEEYDIPY